MSALEPVLRTEIDYARAAESAAELIQNLGIGFERGDPVTFFLRLGPILDGLSIGAAPVQDRNRALYLKHLIVLWNVILDDDIDRHNSRSELDTASQAVSCLLSGAPIPSVTDGKSTMVLREILSRWPTNGSFGDLPFDLYEQVCGFTFDYRTNLLPSTVNSEEYLRYSTLTASIKAHVDVDCLVSEVAPTPADYRQIRSACDCFSIALKLATDIGSLARELHTEQSHGFITVLARERGLSLTTHQDRDSLIARFGDEVRQRSTAALERGRAYLERVESFEVSSLSATVELIMNQYFIADPFG